MVYIFTGDGKGKTSAALGMLLRGLSHGWKVGWISWYKEKRWGISEHRCTSLLSAEAKKRLTFLPMGKGFFLGNGGKKTVRAHTAVISDTVSKEEHKSAATVALEKALELLPNVDLLILDELCNAIADGLVEESAVLQLLGERKNTHVVLTGRNVSSALKKEADLVSSIEKVKHPFDKGVMAMKGLDF